MFSQSCAQFGFVLFIPSLCFTAETLQAPMAQLLLRDGGVVLFGQCVSDLSALIPHTVSLI